MTDFFASAAKIVFVLLASTACITFVTGQLEAKDFMTLAMLSFSFYFGTPNGPTELGGVK